MTFSLNHNAEPRDPFARQTALYCRDFLSPAPTITVHTSGSTGAPKPMQIEKVRMRASAGMTLDFLDIKQGGTALLCMPLEHIGGQMMAVRALVRELQLYTLTPHADPFAAAQDPAALPCCQLPERFDLAAFTPLQAACALDHPASRHYLASCRNVIIGGGFVSCELASRLAALPGRFFHSYGMTETLSHIALKPIAADGAQRPFYPLPGVTVSLSPEHTLQISAPALNPELIVTHDLADLTEDGGFIIRGRLDNILNTGGLKISPEDLERRLAPYLPGDFAVSARPSERLGDELILVTEQEAGEDVLKQAFSQLPRAQRPKAVIKMALPRTATQKIDRPALRSLLAKTGSSI